MKKFISWIVTVFVAVLLVALAIANRNIALLNLDPFPWAVELPLYALLYAAAFIGLVVGALTQWWVDRRWRREARLRRRETAELRKELAALKAAGSQERAPTAELLSPTP